MKRVLSVIVLTMLLLMIFVPAALANQDAIRDSCVRVFAEDSTGAWIGTAFAVGEANKPVRYFVTNRHVAEGATSLNIIFDNSNNMVPCNVEAISDRCDLAVLVLDSSVDVKRKPAVLRKFDAEAEFGNSTEAVWAYGYPAYAIDFRAGGTGDALRADTHSIIVTDGTISTVGENATTQSGQIIMHTADISGGNSGGPLVDKDGYVLGVNAFKKYESVEDNTGSSSYAVSTNEVIRLLESEKIPYTTTGDVKKQRMLIIALIAGGVVIIAAVVAVLIRRKGDKASKYATGGQRRVLVCESGALVGHAPFVLKAKTTIGRVKNNPDIAFPDKTGGVSGLHCTVFFENGVVKVRDEHSSYGTWIDNIKLQPGQLMVMHRGQKLYLGSKQQVLSLRS